LEIAGVRRQSYCVYKHVRRTRVRWSQDGECLSWRLNSAVLFRKVYVGRLYEHEVYSSVLYKHTANISVCSNRNEAERVTSDQNDVAREPSPISIYRILFFIGPSIYRNAMPVSVFRSVDPFAHFRAFFCSSLTVVARDSSGRRMPQAVYKRCFLSRLKFPHRTVHIQSEATADLAVTGSPPPLSMQQWARRSGFEC